LVVFKNFNYLTITKFFWCKMSPFRIYKPNYFRLVKERKKMDLQEPELVPFGCSFLQHIYNPSRLRRFHIRRNFLNLNFMDQCVKFNILTMKNNSTFCLRISISLVKFSTWKTHHMLSLLKSMNRNINLSNPEKKC